jgi:hypothetical protein
MAAVTALTVKHMQVLVQTQLCVTIMQAYVQEVWAILAA